MTRPLKISGTDLKEMTDAEMDYAAHLILTEFAASNTGVGTVNINGTGTSIGTFIDTYRPNAIGTHPVGTTIISEITTFKQDYGTAAESLTRPVELSSSNVRQQSDTSVNDNIIKRALDRLTSGGLGVYTMQVSAPTSGGTWVAIGTITDTAQSGNTQTTLWRRITEGTPTTARPMKTVTDGLREMSDAEIKSLTNRFRNRIVSSGIGQYRVQTNAPTTGTWVRQGSIFYDSRQQVSNINYAGNYTGYFSGNYTGYYTGYYAGSRPRTYSGWYTGSYARDFAGSYTGYYTRYYAGVAYGSYTGYYTGYYRGYFVGSYLGYYTGYYAANYAGAYAGTYTGTYSRAFTGYYTGLTVVSTKENPSNVSLWLRTA